VNDVDARLTAALGADAPPEHDALFRLDVLARIARARFRRQLVRTTAFGLVVVVIGAVNIQTIDAWIATDPRHPWIVAVAALGALLAIPGMPIAAMPGLRTVTRMFGRWCSG
jgi:hypothetical protein